MKPLLVSVLLLLLIPTTTFAYTRHRHTHQSPPPTSQPPPTPPVATSTPVSRETTGVCIGYGYQPISNGQYDMTQVNADLAKLKAAGINCLRLAFYGTNSSVTKPLALAAKNSGFYVIIGNDGNPTDTSYGAGVVADATWAQANHIDQLSIGNEAAKNSQTQQALATLSCEVKKIYSGTVSYDTYLDPNFDEIKLWAQNKGCLDKLGLNIYANYANTMSEAKQYLGTGFYVSETNLDCDYHQCDNDATWATGLKNVLSIEQAYNVPMYVFSYNAGGDAVNPHWGISTHPQVAAILGL